MLSRLPFLTDFRFVQFLVIAMLAVTYAASIFVKQTEARLFKELSAHYIAPQHMLNEVKNIYDVNILETAESLNRTQITRSDARDILSSAQQLMKKVWNEHYGKAIMKHYDLTDTDHQMIDLFHHSMLEVDEKVTLLLAHMKTGTPQEIRYFVQMTLAPTIRQSEYLLDDLIAHNITEAAKAAGEIKTTIGKLFATAGTVALIITLFLFWILHKVGQNMRLLNKKNDHKASKLSSLNKELAYQAAYDSLTGLPNRSKLVEHIEQMIKKSNLYKFNFAVVFLDLDHFKNINDTLGHDIGDALLIKIANQIKMILPEEDLCARIGGDEFVIVLREQHEKQQLALALQTVLEQINRPLDIEGHKLQVGSSIGAALYPDDSKTAEGLMKNADMAMYKAKQSGRNNFAFFTEELNRTAHEEVKIEQAMPGALERGEFKLYHQVKVSGEGEIVGAEALIRWEHPELGIIYPGRFIYLAESTGFIQSLGTWIIEESCRTIADLNRLGHHAFKLSFNVSMRQIQHEQFYPILQKALSKYDVDPSQLKAEITESLLSDNIEHTLKELDRVRSLGVLLCMDDFGTGYSSLSFLHQLPLHSLKIDKAFVDHIRQDGNREEKGVLIDTIVAMGKALGLMLVAEGVEQKYQIAYLKKLGCDVFQGYEFSEAIPEEQLIVLLEDKDQFGYVAEL